MNTTTKQLELFPEVLLVEAKDGEVFTTSRKVAEYFGKKHQHVMRSIKKLTGNLPDTEFWRSNFGPSTYQDERGKEQPMYRLTHDGFALLAMGFTGQKAMEWKVKFLKAFHLTERKLAESEARFARVLDQVRPCLRPVVEASERGEKRAAIGGRLGKSAASITYHRHQARRFGLMA